MPKRWLQWEDSEEWGEIYCPMLGKRVMTYTPKGYTTFYSYTAPFVDADGDVCYYKYDHDYNIWDDVIFCIGNYEDGVVCRFKI